MNLQANPEKSATSEFPHSLVIALCCALLALLYWQTAAFDYVFFDDADYVIKNRDVVGGLTTEGIRWAFSSFAFSNWHPLTWLSHMLDVSLFGLSPRWAHIHNALLHGVVSLLVYMFLIRMSASRVHACLLSLIFLVHPLHVESVAWIAERKDLLCALFYMAGLLVYDSYRALPSRMKYAGVLLCFILALLSKPMAVSFPAVLLILDFFVYRKRFTTLAAGGSKPHNGVLKIIVEKIPFIILSAASCAVTIVAQDAGSSLASLESVGLVSRLGTTINAYLIYLKQSLIPIDLAVFYPNERYSSLSEIVLPGTIFLTVLGLTALYAKRFPLLAAGLCLYLVILLPVIGLVQVGGQAHADRYMYLPFIGLLLACIPFLPARGLKYHGLTNALCVVFIVYLSFICYWQIGHWKNQQSLFSRALAVSGSNYKIHIHLAEGHLRLGSVDDARSQSMAAIELRSDLPAAFNIMGKVAMAEGDFESAEHLFRATLAKGAPLPDVLNNLGTTLVEQGKYPAAIEAFEWALQLDPQYLPARRNLKEHGGKWESTLR